LERDPKYYFVPKNILYFVPDILTPFVVACYLFISLCDPSTKCFRWLSHLSVANNILNLLAIAWLYAPNPDTKRGADDIGYYLYSGDLLISLTYVAFAFTYPWFHVQVVIPTVTRISKFPRPKLETFVLHTLPATFANLLCAMIFVSAQTASCINDELGFPAACNDIVASNSQFQHLFLMIFYIAIFAIPSSPQKRSYDMRHVLFLDFKFLSEQLQVISFVLTAISFLIFYASAKKVEPGSDVDKTGETDEERSDELITLVSGSKLALALARASPP